MTLLFVSLFALAAMPAVATSQDATAARSDLIRVAAADTGKAKAKPADAKKAKKAKKAGKAKAGTKKAAKAKAGKK